MMPLPAIAIPSTILEFDDVITTVKEVVTDVVVVAVVDEFLSLTKVVPAENFEKISSLIIFSLTYKDKNKSIYIIIK